MPIPFRTRRGVVSNYKITKSESYSQQRITNEHGQWVVSNYKITKSESYSQLNEQENLESVGCI